MMERLLRKIRAGSKDKGYVIILTLAGTLAGGLLFYFFLHKPLLAAAEDCNRQAAEAVREVTAVTNFQNAHLNMKEYRAELKKREQRVMQYLPENLSQGEFILYLERLAMRSKMELQMVNPQKSELQGDVFCLPLKLKLTGSYFCLLKFLQGLQEGERLAVVKNMSIEAKENMLSVSMLLNIYAVPVK